MLRALRVENLSATEHAEPVSVQQLLDLDLDLHLPKRDFESISWRANDMPKRAEKNSAIHYFRKPSSLDQFLLVRSNRQRNGSGEPIVANLRLSIRPYPLKRFITVLRKLSISQYRS